ncbi:hypothetical protein B0H16DRAFT_1238431, partial [Mycena metata]
ATDEKGNIHCQNLTCRTQAGNRTRGHTQCIEFKCKSCCTAASLDAGDAHKPRDPCKAHGVESVSDHQYLAGAVVVPAAPAPAAAARRVNGRAAGTRALAQPIGPLWRDTHQKADDAKAAVESLKTRRLEMDAREKKTCELVIFYKAGVMPLVLAEYIDTYPRLQLSSLPDLVAGLKLGSESRLDHWIAGSWKTIQISSILTVENDRRTLLKLRPSLLEEIPLSECPGLTEELTRQPRVHGRKRPGDLDESGSPAKVARPHSMADAAAAAHAQPVIDLATDTSTVAPQRPLAPAAVISHAVPAARRVQNPAPATTSSRPETWWIQNLSVSQYDSGWHDIRALQDSNPKYKAEKAAFPEVFGHKYSKSTVNKYKTLWDSDACKALRDKYIAMGDVPQASMAHLLHAMKG